MIELKEKAHTTPLMMDLLLIQESEINPMINRKEEGSSRRGIQRKKKLIAC